MPTAEIYKKGIKITEIDTPSIVVDLNIAEENIKKMQNFANDNNVSMRPHSKTNKSPYWAKKQIQAGAIGICCAKLGEAEMMAAGGVNEILIPNQIVTPEKINRLVEVNKISKVMVAVENKKNIDDKIFISMIKKSLDDPSSFQMKNNKSKIPDGSPIGSFLCY